MEPPKLIDAMRALADALERFDAEAAAGMQLGRNDALALRYLCEQGPASPGAIMQRLGLTSGTVTALLDRLERAGLAQRGPHPSDRRALIVAATRAGQAAHRAAHAPLSDLTAKLTQRLPPDRREAVMRQLGDLARMVDWAANRPPA